MIETHVAHFTVDPALAAYLEWIEEDAGRDFDLHDFEVFAAGYRSEQRPVLAARGDGR